MFSVSKRPTISEVHDLYKSGKALPTQVFYFFVNRSKQIDKKIHSVQTFTTERGLEEAEKCDQILAEYKETYNNDFFNKIISTYPLFGIPYSLKAIIQAEGIEFTASSKILEGYIAPYSSTVYENIHKAGAILIAVNYMDEFAMGASGENNAYGVTRNPFNENRVPGGSSSGPAAAVGSGQVVFALGTDTGGSIRQPSSFCDVVGLKPTYGAVSRYGVIPMASSFDQVGPISNSVGDSAMITSILYGKDENDQTTIDSTEVVSLLQEHQKSKPSRPIKSITKSSKPLNIGIPKEFYIDGADSQILAALKDLQHKLEKLGHSIIPVSIPLVSYAVATYYMTMSVEVASNLERYDGVRYRGNHETDVKEDMYFDYRFAYFGDEAKRRILLGTYASSAGYYDAFYNRAAKVKELARRQFNQVFEKVDVLLTPTAPEFPFEIGSKSNDPLLMYLSDVFTAVVNPVRIPGLVVPLGFFEVSYGNVEYKKDENGDFTDEKIGTVQKTSLPTGCQILGPELSEDVLYSLGEEIELLVASRS